MKSGMGRNNDPDPEEPEEINFYSTKDEYGWLSNFYSVNIFDDNPDHPCLVDYEGAWYMSVEHAYQAYKTLDNIWFDRISKAGSPGEAKNLGRQVSLRANWQDIKVSVMLKFLRLKFDHNHDDLREKLLATGDAVIHEDSPTDRFWGKKGQDMLGKLIMRVREELWRESEVR